MINKRIIAKLDVKNDALVKGIHLEGLRVLGSPKDFAEKYYNDGVDEIIYMDVVASLYGRNGLVTLVKETSKNIFVPLTVGGGIRSLEDVKELLASGADKVCINTAAVKTPSFISEIAEIYGSSTVVVAIEAINVDGEFQVFIDNGREYTGLNVLEWALKVESLGAGEILLTSVDQEGTGRGLDYELISEIQGKVSIPLVVHGGLGKMNDVFEAFSDHNLDAVCAASLFHYDAIKTLVGSRVMGNTSFLESKGTKSNLEALSIVELKLKLKSLGVRTR